MSTFTTERLMLEALNTVRVKPRHQQFVADLLRKARSQTVPFSLSERQQSYLHSVFKLHKKRIDVKTYRTLITSTEEDA